MLKKLKKGFTLAELLIVIAIIAVLTAIAVPLFMGAVNDAKGARDDANIGALKSEAAIYILRNSNNTAVWPKEVEGDKIEGWAVDGTIGKDGSVTVTKVVVVTKNKTNTATKPTETKAEWVEGVCNVTGIWLPRSEVSDTIATTVPSASTGSSSSGGGSGAAGTALGVLSF